MYNMIKYYYHSKFKRYKKITTVLTVSTIYFISLYSKGNTVITLWILLPFSSSLSLFFSSFFFLLFLSFVQFFGVLKLYPAHILFYFFLNSIFGNHLY